MPPHVADAVERAWPRGAAHHFRRRLIWAAVILAIVGIPLALFALVGLPHLFRSTHLRNVIARERVVSLPTSRHRTSGPRLPW